MYVWLRLRAVFVDLWKDWARLPGRRFVMVQGTIHAGARPQNLPLATVHQSWIQKVTTNETSKVNLFTYIQLKVNRYIFTVTLCYASASQYIAFYNMIFTDSAQCKAAH